MERSRIKPSKQSWQDNLKKIWQKIWAGIKKFVALLKKWLAKAGQSLKELWRNFLKSFARWVDPRLEPYREKSLAEKANEVNKVEKEKIVVEEMTYTPPEMAEPTTREDLFMLIREAPMSVLTSQERKAMAAVLELPDTQVRTIMTPAQKMVFVNKDETLGPLVLDKLYKSGFVYFPVVDGRDHIIGTLQTALLNSLEIRETSTAEHVMDPRVYYIRLDYTLEQALKAFLRTGSQVMIVIDNYEKLMGMLTFPQLIDYLFTERYRDDFDGDDDRIAVAKRR